MSNVSRCSFELLKVQGLGFKGWVPQQSRGQFICFWDLESISSTRLCLNSGHKFLVDV